MKTLLITLIGLLMVSCDQTTSLQEYYVENQEKNEFLSLDIPTSLVLGDNSNLTEEQKATLGTIKKINLIAFPLKGENQETYEEEKSKVTSILSDEDFIRIWFFKEGATKAEFYYTGKEDAIDEFIIYGSDAGKGFGIARILGDDMKPEDLIKLFQSAEKGDLDLAGLEGLLKSQQ